MVPKNHKIVSPKSSEMVQQNHGNRIPGFLGSGPGASANGHENRHAKIGTQKVIHEKRWRRPFICSGTRRFFPLCSPLKWLAKNVGKRYKIPYLSHFEKKSALRGIKLRGVSLTTHAGSAGLTYIYRLPMMHQKKK